MNPWKSIRLSDYESHMALPAIGQAAMLAEELKNAITTARPTSLALLGCAGGNGLEALRNSSLERIVCVDINPIYLEALKIRYQEDLPNLECHESEVEGFRSPSPVDLVFGGLIFEYTRLEEALESVSRLLGANGEFYALLQMPAPGISTVSPSPYAQSLSGVMGIFQYVAPARMIELSKQKGLTLLENRMIRLESGKSFAVMRFIKDNGH
jgi:SAM-dependent methyltransferase